MEAKTYYTKTNKEIRLWQGDCMELMKGRSENYWDLVIADPPYGRQEHGGTNRSGSVIQRDGTRLYVTDGGYKKKAWDSKPTPPEYFGEATRVSENQIIWGVNNFKYQFGSGRIVWDKVNGKSDQFDCEIAYQSKSDRVDLIRYMWSGMCQGKSISEGHLQQGDKRLNENRIHPTQKPVKLYRWILASYAEQGDIILDTHGGSMSLAIACYIEGFELDIIELDKDYYKAAVKRFEQHISQKALF